MNAVRSVALRLAWRELRHGARALRGFGVFLGCLALGVAAIAGVQSTASSIVRIYKDPAITTPAGRMKAFGQRDHVRRYGKDFLDRLRAAGFHAEVVRARDVYSDEDAGRCEVVRVVWTVRGPE